MALDRAVYNIIRETLRRNHEVEAVRSLDAAYPEWHPDYHPHGRTEAALKPVGEQERKP